jgi:hypothetical protein
MPPASDPPPAPPRPCKPPEAPAPPAAETNRGPGCRCRLPAGLAPIAGDCPCGLECPGGCWMDERQFRPRCWR